MIAAELRHIIYYAIKALRLIIGVLLSYDKETPTKATSLLPCHHLLSAVIPERIFWKPEKFLRIRLRLSFTKKTATTTAYGYAYFYRTNQVIKITQLILSVSQYSPHFFL
ncbi:hypothetical protein [Agarilytica rhodophyticola]|uniref:hypothetical protein n=1 Tax=Agarilytica rhodophyticola TaxID=1737490 RepID=UPI000CD98771|nr:hypothetical protein [Agarilytica rhodophyticola]